MKLGGVLSRTSQSPLFVLQGAVSSWCCGSRILFMSEVSLQYFTQQLDKIRPVRKLTATTRALAQKHLKLQYVGGLDGILE